MQLQRISFAILALSVLQADCKSEIHLNCGRRLVNHEALIVNGYESKEGDWPWHTSILHIDTSLNIQYKCGGTLLDANSILTAAHCVYENGRPIVADRVLIQLGRHNLKLTGTHSQEIEVYQTFPHHKYNASSLANDIAIIRLATKAVFNEYVQPICLWDPDREDISSVVGKYGTVVGFGITEENQVSYTLRQATIPVVDLTTCLESDRTFFGNFLSDSTFCAGYTNGTSACNGDSGGSLTFEENGVHRIRGIVSLTQVRPGDHNRFCKTDQYVVFTDVAKYLNWIEEIVPTSKQPPSSTELGYLEMHFGIGNVTQDINGDNCDNCFLCHNPCDPYLIVKINGVEKFRSAIIWDNDMPDFNAKFTSEQIAKDSDVAVEMWDSDANDTGDDLMARWNNLNIGLLSTSIRFLEDRQNMVEVHSKWQKS